MKKGIECFGEFAEQIAVENIIKELMKIDFDTLKNTFEELEITIDIDFTDLQYIKVNICKALYNHSLKNLSFFSGGQIVSPPFSYVELNPMPIIQ